MEIIDVHLVKFIIMIIYCKFFLKFVFLGSFGHLAVLAVGFGASLAGEVFGSNFLSGPRQVKAHDEPYVGRTSKKNIW